jgi:ribosomal protein S18 acetylase RimI-like enzyme
MNTPLEIRPFRPHDETKVVLLVRELQDYESQYFDRMSPSDDIGDLIVTKSDRRLGVGAALLVECEKLARAAGEKWLRLTTLAANLEAVRVYRRFGFTDQFIDMEKPLT